MTAHALFRNLETRSAPGEEVRKDIEAEVRCFIGNNFAAEDEIGAIEVTSSLTESGIIDSTGVLELVAFVQNRYNVTIPDEQIVPENFDSLKGITLYIMALIGVG
jgi:acyl carrier protein